MFLLSNGTDSSGTRYGPEFVRAANIWNTYSSKSPCASTALLTLGTLHTCLGTNPLKPALWSADHYFDDYFTRQYVTDNETINVSAPHRSGNITIQTNDEETL